MFILQTYTAVSKAVKLNMKYVDDVIYVRMGMSGFLTTTIP